MAILEIPVMKAKGKFVSIDTDEIAESVYEYALKLGLKALLNRGMTTTKRENFASQDAFEAEAMKIAEKQKADMVAGKTRIIGATKSKAGGAEATEALRLAKIHAKAQLKAAGFKISHISAADLTTAARALIDSDRDVWMAAARDSLAKAASVSTKSVDLGALVKADPKKVAASEAKKAADKAKREAAKAGKTPPPTKGKGKGKGASLNA